MIKILRHNYQIIIALIVFGVILATHTPFYKAITLLLEFIVIIEVVRMIAEFIEKRQIRLHYAIDIFIVFLIRDVIILVTQPVKKNETIFLLLFIILSFFIFRILALVFSPSTTKSRCTTRKKRRSNAYNKPKPIETNKKI